jgi:hypothetical protein
MAQLKLTNAYPDNGFQAIEFKINNPNQTTESLSGKMRRVGMGISFYSFTVKYPMISRLKMSTLMGFLSQTQGPLYAFDIVLPSISYTKLSNQITGNVTVTGGSDTWTENGTSKTGYKTGRGIITVSGANGNLFAGGDVFRFSNDLNYPGDDANNVDCKVYMATNAVTISGGTGTVYFTGGLVDNVPNGTLITYTAVPFQVIIPNGEQVFHHGQGGLGSLEFDCREVWG